jgi:hypothetical protein
MYIYICINILLQSLLAQRLPSWNPFKIYADYQSMTKRMKDGGIYMYIYIYSYIHIYECRNLMYEISVYIQFVYE